jgi:membrane protein DedA with SNARE-associated domain
MLDWITRTITFFSYPGVAFLMFLENVFPPIPSELIMPLAGYTATRGDLNMVGVIVAGTMGSVLGALPLYWIGRKLGKERIEAWVEKHGCWLALSCEDIERATGWFERHGGAAVFFCRLVPGVRSLISVPAGINQMPLGSFLLYSTLGAGLWTAALAAAGYVLAENFRLVERYLGPIATVVLGLIAAAFVLRVIRHQAQQRKAA